MKFSYGFTNDGNVPAEEQVRLVIEVNGRYSSALAVLDAARLEFEEIQVEDQRRFMDAMFKK